MKARHKDTGEIIELAEEGIISCDGRRFCWYQVELITEPIDDFKPSLPSILEKSEKPINHLADDGKMIEQPVCEDLEKEIQRFLSNATKMDKGEWKGKYPISEMGFGVVARHFAEWGAEHLKKEDKQ